MRHQLKNPRFYVMILSDAAIFAGSFVMAYVLRFDFRLTPSDLHGIGLVLPFLIPAKLVVFFLFGLYRGMWRYAGVEDFWKLAQASLLSSALVVTFVLYAYRFQGFPRSVFLIDCGLAFLITGGLRMVIRSYYNAMNSPHGLRAFSLPSLRGRDDGARRRVLIIGAGGSAEKMLREIFDNPQLHYEVVGLLDDDPAKHHRSVHGVRVLGSVDILPDLARTLPIDEVFISVPSATGPAMRRIVNICKNSGLPFKTLPAIGSILNGNVSVKILRDVNYEDLLRRPPAVLDCLGISRYLASRGVLVTGAGGSIGAELVRQVVKFLPEHLVLFDSSEENLYRIEMELRHELHFHRFECVLGRVQSQPLVESVFRRYRPDVVFHAAAYKHVPMIEKNPWEAVFNNVKGSQVCMDAARTFGSSRFVFVSTDKAVRPTNVMGTSKRLAELLLQSMQDGSTRFMAVRFGNVIGSSGSVIPLFRRQIELGGPVTVTHAEMTRYFMTIPEACQLILQAAALGAGGEIFVLEMGTPVRIADMARDLITLSGKRPDIDIPIVYTGLRPGEKLYEELITADENVVTTRHEKIMVLRANANGAGDAESFRRRLSADIEDLVSLAHRHDAPGIRRKLKELVPEYCPGDNECVL